MVQHIEVGISAVEEYDHSVCVAGRPEGWPDQVNTARGWQAKQLVGKMAAAG